MKTAYLTDEACDLVSMRTRASAFDDWEPSEEDLQELEDIDDGQDGGHQLDAPDVYDSPEAMDCPLDYDTREAMREVQPYVPGMEHPVQQWLPLWRLSGKPGGRTSCTPVPMEPSADPVPAVTTVETPVATRGLDW